MFERAMTCREASNLLPLFFDGELDAHQMRAVALHSTRCDDCEGELRRMERVQGMIGAHVNAAVDEIDLSALWRGIDARLETVHISWWMRVRAWWQPIHKVARNAVNLVGAHLGKTLSHGCCLCTDCDAYGLSNCSARANPSAAIDLRPGITHA